MEIIEEEKSNESNCSQGVELFFIDLQYGLNELEQAGQNVDLWIVFNSPNYDQDRSPILLYGGPKNCTATIQSITALNNYLTLVQSSTQDATPDYTLSLFVRIANKNVRKCVYSFDTKEKIIRNKSTGYSILEKQQIDKATKFESQFFPKSKQSDEPVMIDEASNSRTNNITTEEEQPKKSLCCVML